MRFAVVLAAAGIMAFTIPLMFQRNQWMNHRRGVMVSYPIERLRYYGFRFGAVMFAAAAVTAVIALIF
jgi:hypothetical protein